MADFSAQGAGKQSLQPDPLCYRTREAMPLQLQPERSLTGWAAGGLAWAVCKYLSLLQFGSAVVHRHSILGLLGQHWPRKQTSWVGSLRRRPWKGPWHFQKPFLFAGQQMVALNLQCSQVRKEESI